MRERLRDIRVPGEGEAFVRARTAVLDAHRDASRDHAPSPRRVWRRAGGDHSSGGRRLWRRAVAALALALVAAATFTVPGQAVGEWLRDVVGPQPEAPPERPAALPGPGRVLAAGPDGLSVVGSRDRATVGAFSGATWSPHGRFAAVVSGRRLQAITPAGVVRWRVTPPAAPRDPAWAPDGFRIAYLAGPQLRVVIADGTDDRLFWRRAHDVPPAFRPGHPHSVTWVDDDRRIRVADVDRAVLDWRSPLPVPPGTHTLTWSADGRRVLAAGRRRVAVFTPGVRHGRTHPGGRITAAAFPPRGDGPPAILTRRGARSAIVLLGQRAPLIATRGRYRGLVWSPDGRWLVTAWGARWLFVRADGRRVRTTPGRGTPLAWAR